MAILNRKLCQCTSGLHMLKTSVTEYTVIWNYFVLEKFSWLIKPTKIYCTKKFNMNNKQDAQ